MAVEYETLVQGGHSKFAEEIFKKVKAKTEALDEQKADAISDTAKGAVASFSDGADNVYVKDLKVKLSPIQDLHGYESPWPEGGGKNLFQTTSASTVLNGITYTVNTDGTISMSGTASGPYSQILAGRISLAAGSYVISDGGIGSANIEFYIASVVEASTKLSGSFTLNEDITNNAVYLYVKDGIDVTGQVVKPMICLASATDPRVFEPYSNICPISGRTEATVTRTGVNVWDEEVELGTISSQTGEVANDPSRIRSKNYIPCVPSTQYRFTKINSSPTTDIRPFFYDKSKNFITAGGWSNGNEVQTTPSGCHYMKFICATGYGTTYNNDISINYPTTATDYEPYQGETYDITFPSEAGTVYGGTVDVTNGKLTVDRAMVDLGTLNWNYFAQYDCFYSTGIGGVINHAPFISSIYSNTVSSSVSGLVNGEALLNNAAVYVKDIRFTDATTFKTAVTGQQLVYELATPIELDLTPQQIATLLGTNNIWANGNSEVDVEYYADTKLYIEKLTKPTEDDMIANQNIPSGKFFMVGNSLYLSTSAIASGETIIVGTNCTAVSLADALNTLNS